MKESKAYKQTTQITELRQMKKKVVLYQPVPNPGMEAKEISLALLAIAAMPHERGYEVLIVSHNDKNPYEKILKNVEDAVCFGVTAMTGHQIKDGLGIAKLVKERFPAVPVVFGGWHPSLLPHQTAKNQYVDIVVVGQGQRTFYELVNAIYEHKGPDHVKGLVYKKNGEIKINELREFESLDNFPPMNYDLINVEKHIIKSEYGDRYISYFTSQGCPFNCAFCCETTVYGRKWKCLSAERVLSDIEMLHKKYRINAISIADDNFFVDEKRVVEICKGIIKKKLNIKWGEVDGRTKQLMNFKEETWQLMKDSGLYSVLVGAEGSDETLLYVNKQASLKDTFDLTHRCKKYGIKIWFSFMFGLPPQKDEEARNYKRHLKKEFDSLMKLFDKLMEISQDNIFLFCLYTPYPGNPIYENAKKYGFKEPGSLEEWANFSLFKANTPWLPKKYANIANQLNFLYFPFMSNTLPKIYGKSFLFKLTYPLVRRVLYFRWKKRFFYLPFEYCILRFILWSKLCIKKITAS